MSNLSKQLYRKIYALFPDLETIEPFTNVDFTTKGYLNVHIGMLESNPDKINFILTRYHGENCTTVANPSIEVIINPIKRTANAVTYKDPQYFHAVVKEQKEIGTMALCVANSLLYDLLKDIKKQNYFQRNEPFALTR